MHRIHRFLLIGALGVFVGCQDSAGTSDDGSLVDPDVPPPALTVLSELLLDGGGTHNAIAFSPGGEYLGAFADIGGTRIRKLMSEAWEYKPVAWNNAHRQVAGGLVLEDGTIFQLVGNSASSGELQEISPDGEMTPLATGLAIFANRPSNGDAGARPRPVGWIVAYDSQNDLIYYCTEEGVYRYDRGSGVDDGRIALDSVSCRGFAHTNGGHMPDSDRLVVCTRTKGLVEISGPQGADPRALRISDASMDRFEDAAVIDATAGTYLGVGHVDGVYRYSGNGSIRVNGSERQNGDPQSVVATRYELAIEADLNWSSGTGDLIANWNATGGASAQQHRLLLDAGVLEYRFRHSGGSLATIVASAPVSLTGRGLVRVRREDSDVFFEQSPGGIDWAQIGNVQTTLSDAPDANSSQDWVIGANLPNDTTIHRAWVRVLGSPEPAVSLDLSGVVASALEGVGVAGDTWQLNGTLTAGGQSVTPLVDSTGANGGDIRWTCAATMNVSGDVAAVIGVVNPNSATEWLYRSTDVEAASPSWSSGSPSVATIHPGSSYFSPANRVLGASASGGTNLTGVFNLSFDPSDPTGNTVVVTSTLSLFRTTNFMTSMLSGIAWESYNDSLSMLSVIDVCIDDEGGVTWTVADHNAYSIGAQDLLSAEPFEASFSGISDAWGVASIGTGADKVTILAASSDTDPTDPNADVAFHRGAGPAQGWTTTGYQADTDGLGALSTNEVPRPGGAFLWNKGNGSYGAVVYGDGVGWIRSTYTLASNSWSTWAQQGSGPTANLTTANVAGVRAIVGDPFDGVPILGLHLSTGQVYVSTDGEGATWDRITSIASSDTRRKGRMAYDPGGDCAIVSDAGALTRIDAVSLASPTETVIDTDRSDYGPVAFDANGRAYVHMHDTGELLCFESFSTATSLGDAEDVSVGTNYASRTNGLAMQMTIGFVDGVERGITTYQGAGTVTWTVPR